MALDNDEENMDTIQRLLAEIKREKQVIRDEVHVIKGELSTAMYNEDLRKRLTGEWRRLKMEQSTEEELEEMREQERDREKRPSTGSSGATYRETSF
ncbi:hypothetical protein WR25_08352 [Diploscapter pachys]|uniref:Uncharacterized protein n=1 Tax=Diploscapter pachys TaxID=2018661 RepID=A0A2A2K6X6_9BILA|nr:hypothetical protein WR25_08352 [Diploscapter pachys]